MNFRKHFPVFWRIFPALRDILPGLWQEYQQVQKKHRQIGAILSAEVLGKVRILYENQPPVRAGGCRRPLIGRHCLYAVLGLSQKGAKSAAIFLTVLHFRSQRAGNQQRGGDNPRFVRVAGKAGCIFGGKSHP